MPKARDLPKNMADSFDDQVKAFHGFLVEQRKEFRKRTGDRPFKGQEVSQNEKMIQLGNITSQDWTAIFQKHGIVKEDGRILLPNDMLKQAKDVHKLSKQGEINL